MTTPSQSAFGSYMLGAKQELSEMVYVVQAGLKERGSGTFKVEAKTRRGAIEKARDLRKQGLEVTITGPDGKPVDETEGE